MSKLYTYHRKKSSTVVFHISFKNMRVRFFNRNVFMLVHSDAVPIFTRLFVLKVTSTLSFCTCITNNYYNDSNYIPFLQLQNHFGRGRPIEGCYLLHSDEVFHLHCTCITKLSSEYLTNTMVRNFRGLRKFFKYRVSDQYSGQSIIGRNISYMQESCKLEVVLSPTMAKG